MRATWDATEALGPARSEFGRRGYGAASVVAIIEQSGTTRATFYKHYESKQRLFFCAVLSALADFADTLPEPSRHQPFWGEVQALLTAGHRFGESHPDDLLLIHEGLYLARDCPDEPTARLVVDAVRDHTGRWVDRGSEAGEIRTDLGRDLAVDLIIAVVQTIDRRTLLARRHAPAAGVLAARTTDLLRRMLASDPSGLTSVTRRAAPIPGRDRRTGTGR